MKKVLKTRSRRNQSMLQLFGCACYCNSCSCSGCGSGSSRDYLNIKNSVANKDTVKAATMGTYG